jgi:hypothetical protein
MDAIVKLHPDLVLITEFSSGYIRGSLTDLGSGAVDLQVWTEGLNRSLDELQQAGISVSLLRDTPTPHRNIGNCLATADWRQLPSSGCDTNQEVALNSIVTTAERDEARIFKSVHFVDLTSAICQGGVCPGMRDGIVVYRDSNHLTTRYAAHLTGALLAELNPALEQSSRSLRVTGLGAASH